MKNIHFYYSTIIELTISKWVSEREYYYAEGKSNIKKHYLCTIITYKNKLWVIKNKTVFGSWQQA